MRYSKLAIVFTAASMLMLALPAAAETYTVVSPVPFSEKSQASREVKETCTLDIRLPQFVEKFAKRGVEVVIAGDPGENVEGKVLYLEIVHVLGTGGGAWSGAKSVTVEGVLKENGEVIGSFTGARYSGGGAFGGFKGTCAILGRCIETLGKDIATWLKNPTMNAMLGNA
jgi:hypothetical protein